MDSNEALAQKMSILVDWGLNALTEIRSFIVERHLMFMSSTTMEEAQQRADILSKAHEVS